MNITEKLTERIKAQFVELLTDEELDEIVKKEIDSFFDENTKSYFKVESKRDYFKGAYQELSFEGNMSPIRQIVYRLLLEMTSEKLRQGTINDYFNKNFVEADGTIKNKTEELIKEGIPLAINSYFENISRNMMMTLQQSITNNSY
jgi:hypothetical protein